MAYRLRIAWALGLHANEIGEVLAAEPAQQAALRPILTSIHNYPYQHLIMYI